MNRKVRLVVVVIVSASVGGCAWAFSTPTSPIENAAAWISSAIAFHAFLNFMR